MPKKILLLLLGFVGLIINSSNYVESILIPAISQDFWLEIHQAGIIATAYFLCFGASTLFAGPLADRYGKTEIIILSVIFFTSSMILSSLATGLKSLVFFRALSGIFAAPVLPVSNALISDIFVQRERQLALGIFQSICMIGQCLCMLVGGILIIFLGWRSMYALIAICAFLSLFMLFPVKKKLVSRKNKDLSIIANYKTIFQVPANRQTYLVILVQGGLILGLISYLGAYIKSVVNLNFFLTGLIISSFGVTTLLFSGVGSKLAGKWGQKKVILTGLFFGMLANIILFCWGKFILFIAMAPVFLGLTFIFSHVTLLSIVSEFSIKARGSALAIVAGCFIAGGGIGAAVGGYVIGSFGYQTLFLLYALTFLTLIFLVRGYFKLPYTDQRQSDIKVFEALFRRKG